MKNQSVKIFISCHISKSVESIFKHFHILNEFNERKFLTENRADAC